MNPQNTSFPPAVRSAHQIEPVLPPAAAAPQPTTDPSLELRQRDQSGPTPPTGVPQQTHEEAVQLLRQEIDNSNQILIRANSVFPFMLFPDTIVIDRHKMTITRRSFFSVAEIISVRIEDLLHVTANIGPFFGTIQVTDRFFENKKPYRITYLPRNDALRIKRILQGYIIAIQKQIDCSTFAPKELTSMLTELGTSAQADA